MARKNISVPLNDYARRLKILNIESTPFYMTYKEAFIRCLKGEIIHPVPWSVKFTAGAQENYENFLGGRFDAVIDTGTYVVASHTNNGWEELKPGYFRDYFGVIWNKTRDMSLGVPSGYLISKPTLRNFRFPEVESLPVLSFIRENDRKFPDHFHMLSIGFTLFERAWTLTGMEQLMLWFLTEPAFVHELLQQITEYNCRLIRAAVETGKIDCVHFADDWGGQNGLIMGRELWQEFIRPGLITICQEVRKHRLLASLHSCGKVEELIPEMIDAGVDVFDPFQPEVMDIFGIYNEYSGRLAFWGGLSVQRTFPFGTPEQVTAEGKMLLDKMGSHGRYILSPSHTLTVDIPPANVKAFLDLARCQQVNDAG